MELKRVVDKLEDLSNRIHITLRELKALQMGQKPELMQLRLYNNVNNSIKYYIINKGRKKQ